MTNDDHQEDLSKGTETAIGIAKKVAQESLGHPDMRAAIAKLAHQIPGIKADLTEYVASKRGQHYKFKNIYTKNYTLDIRYHYLPLRFSTRKTHESITLEPEQIRKLGGRVLISSGAGAGKTSVLKYLYSRFADESLDFPILLYLKDVMQSLGSSVSNSRNVVVELVRAELSVKRTLSYEYALEVLKGNVVLMLDAFDELPISVQKRFLRDILDIPSLFPNLKLIITSRPDGLLSSLDAVVVSCNDISTRDLGEMIQRLEKCDRSEEEQHSKLEEFGRYLNESATPAVKDFCRKPLTGIMCYMVFKIQGRIENSIAAFYSQLVHTLWSEHDNTKSLAREQYPGCNITNIVKILEYCCSRTFLVATKENQLKRIGAKSTSRSMMKEDILQFIDEAIVKFALPIDGSETVLRVLQSSMSLMAVEGSEVEYMHRSFEEYFTACYINRLSDNDAHFVAWAEIIRKQRGDEIAHKVLAELCTIEYWKHIYLPEARFWLETSLSMRVEALSILESVVCDVRYAEDFGSLPDFTISEFKEMLEEDPERLETWSYMLRRPDRDQVRSLPPVWVLPFVSDSGGCAGVSGIGGNAFWLSKIANDLLQKGSKNAVVRVAASFLDEYPGCFSDDAESGDSEIERMEQMLFIFSSHEYAELAAIVEKRSLAVDMAAETTQSRSMP